MNAQDLKTKLTEYIEHLAALTDDAARSEAMQKWFTACATFYRYSLNNQLLILFARPDASLVAGYNDWKKRGRQVQRGEHGIPILAPCTYHEDPENDSSPIVVKGFRVVFVFDVSQTDGEELPAQPTWISPAREAELERRLTDFAHAQGIRVETKELTGQTQGYSEGGSIVLSSHAGTKTLIHEIAHEILKHHGAMLDHRTRETEAEAVAYTVACHFGLPDLASPNYLALVHSDKDLILAHMTRIREVSALIISGVEG